MGHHGSKLSKKELQELQKKTNYDSEKLKKLFKELKFYKKRELKFDEICQIMSKILQLSLDDENDVALLKRLFDLFDLSHSGTISFAEFACGLSVLCSEGADNRQFLFQLFDLNGDGKISKDEVTQMVSGLMRHHFLQDVLRVHIIPSLSVGKYVDEFFETVDLNRDGAISLTEFSDFLDRERLDPKEHEHHETIKREDSPPPEEQNVGKRGRLLVVIVGVPLSNKEMIGEIIAEKNGLVFVSCGKLLLEGILNETESGKKASGFISAGQLVPDNLLFHLIENRLEQPDCLEKGWVLVGFPRTWEQVLFMNQGGIVPSKFVAIDLSDDIVNKTRILVDKKTNQMYPETMTPKDTRAKNNLRQSTDGDLALIDCRLQNYRKNIDNILKYYGGSPLRLHNVTDPDELVQLIQDYVTQK